MKVLFLDVDGVLNSLEWFASQARISPCSVNPKAVARVRRLVEETGCELVLSSSWRHVPDLVRSLHDLGLRCYGSTPELRDQPRGAEIAAWLANHPEVTTFAIIDDDADAGSHHPDRFVRTYPKHGMYGKHEQRLRELLSEPVAREVAHG